jgi:chemotaxis protein methyltransferase CheR
MGSDHAFLVETRLANLARKEGFDSLERMIEELFSTGQGRLALHVVSTLVERDTHFNRDPQSFDLLFNVALPDLISKRGGGRIDLLSYGCGSGQDLYSIAIRARHTAEAAMLAPVEFHLRGVDYPSQSLERAQAGRYTHFEIQRGLSARDMIANFIPDPAPGSTDWLAAAHLHENLSFQEMHLMSGTDEKESFHIVMFRGAIGHYSRPARLRVTRTLTKLLKPKGYLIMGPDESLGDEHFGLDPIAGCSGLYQRHAAEPVAPVGKQPTDKTDFHQSDTRQASKG